MLKKNLITYKSLEYLFLAKIIILEWTFLSYIGITFSSLLDFLKFQIEENNTYILQLLVLIIIIDNSILVWKYNKKKGNTLVYHL